MQDMDHANCVRKAARSESSKPILVLFLHGSGDSGPGFRHTLHMNIPLEELLPNNCVILFPTAQQRPYTPMMGHLANVWFDRPRLHYDAVEDSATLHESIISLERTLSDAVTSCIFPDPLVFLVGFSMGGSMALHLAFHVVRTGFSVNGVFVHSSFIGRHSKIIPDVKRKSAPDGSPDSTALRIFFAHGKHDRLVPCEWGRSTVERLRKHGHTVDFQEVEGLGHDISTESLRLMKRFIRVVCSES